MPRQPDRVGPVCPVGPATSAGRRRLGAGWRLGTALVLLLGWLVAGLVLTVPAGAHAELVATTPADSARLAAAPARVTLRFSENVELSPGYLQVTDTAGRHVEAGRASFVDGDRSRLSVGLRPALGPGSYLVSYAIVSADSHPVSGGYAFVVGSGPLVAAGGGAGGGPVVSGLLAVTRWAGFAALALLGGLVFVVSFWPGGRTDFGTARLARAGWRLGLVATVAALLLQGPAATGGGLAAAVHVGGTMSTAYGRVLVLRVVAYALLGWVCARTLRDQAGIAERTRHRTENLGLLCGVALVASYAAAGHASDGVLPTDALLSDMIHLAAMAVWLGGLLVLGIRMLPAARPAELAAAVPRFSRLAFGAVCVLVGTGTYQAWRSLGGVSPLWTTGYGRLLLLKLAVVAALLALANASRQAIRRRAVPVDQPNLVLVGASAPVGPDEPAPDPAPGKALLTATGRRRLRRSVLAEIGVAVAVLAVSAVLVGTPPAAGGGETAGDGPQWTTVALAGGATATLALDPGRADTVTAELRDRQGRPLRPRDVDLTIALPAERLGPLPVRLAPTGPGDYRGSAAALSRPGRWRLALRVRTSEFDASVATAELATG
jgi:copper transport protein